jgi:osmoprotectant transport system permease protein
MSELIRTFAEQKSELGQALLQHIGISVLSLLIAILIAMPLAIWATHHRKIAELLLQITGVLQTIPSLALLGLLIPLVGIGSVPAVIALVIYALLPIFQSTYVGITEIDPSLEEAADAFGMRPLQKLFRVELPTAMPVIISGIRTGLVLIIGTATLAALIGAGGLGNFILLGINRNDSQLILVGAISSALLAIILSALINVIQRLSIKKMIITLAVLVIGAGGVSFIKLVAPKTETITIAGKLGAEPDILINMYKELIEQKSPHTKVVLKQNFGETTFLFNALKSNKIDIYPEFTGTVLETLVKKAPTQKSSAQQTYRDARKLLKQQFHMEYLKPMQYQNTNAIVVKKDFAKGHNLKTISDLKNIEDQLKGGMTLEFIHRKDGLVGIKKAYGLGFPIRSMQASLRYSALKNGQINVADAYSTDSQIRQLNLTTLKDDQHVFPPYQGAPLMQANFAKRHPQIVKALNQLAGKITETEMQEMNYEVNVKKKSADVVAHNYLVKKGLLKGDEK